MIVAATGHRPNKIGGYKLPNPKATKLYAECLKRLKALGATKGISGMALGWDQWFATACSELSIPWIAAVPFKGQESAWPAESQAQYRELLSEASEVVIVSGGLYEPRLMQIRNEWMVDRADVILACWDGSSGGTGNCVRYARAKNKRIEVVDPREF